MVKLKQRLVFNLKDFVDELEESLNTTESDKDFMEEVQYIDDVVTKLKDFINNSSKTIVKSSYTYLMNHPSVVENSRMRSFITPCFN